MGNPLFGVAVFRIPLKIFSYFSGVLPFERLEFQTFLGCEIEQESLPKSFSFSMSLLSQKVTPSRDVSHFACNYLWEMGL